MRKWFNRVCIGVIAVGLAFLAIPNPHFTTQAQAAEAYRTITYGYGHGNITANKGWSVQVADTTGAPIATLIFQSDCNLVEYRYVNHVTTVTWNSGTVRPIGTACTLVFQGDGNVVIYTAYAIWATGTNYGTNWVYQYDISSNGENDIWWYQPGYGWHWGLG
jgi:hypothetical protein